MTTTTSSLTEQQKARIVALAQLIVMNRWLLSVDHRKEAACTSAEAFRIAQGAQS